MLRYWNTRQRDVNNIPTNAIVDQHFQKDSVKILWSYWQQSTPEKFNIKHWGYFIMRPIRCAYTTNIIDTIEISFWLYATGWVRVNNTILSLLPHWAFVRHFGRNAPTFFWDGEIIFESFTSENNAHSKWVMEFSLLELRDSKNAYE